MEMKKINAGKLRAIGYDAGERLLRVEFEDGTAIDYSGVNGDLWRRFSSSGVAWSFYRDNIEDEFTGRKGTVKRDTDQRKKLDDLFKTAGGDAGNPD